MKRFKKSQSLKEERCDQESSVASRSSAGQWGDTKGYLQKVVVVSQWIQLKATPVMRKLDWTVVRSGGLILALSFVAASSVSTFAVSALMTSGQKSSTTAQAEGAQVRVSGEAKTSDDSGLSVSILERQILDRNLFNSSGELAPEIGVEADKQEKTSGLDFEAVPCSNEKLPVSVLGTIFTGDPFASFVTVKDAKVSYADTYKAGNLVIDYEDFEVYKVLRDQVEFRKGDQKICVTLKVIGAENGQKAGIQGVDKGSELPMPENIVNLEFEAEELAEGIGPGYANILNSAKLIPALEGGNVIGFKLIAIKPDSLFRKMKLENRDIITEVNGVSLKDASEGFKLYQALQEEREINIRVVRGETVMTYLVRVK